MSKYKTEQRKKLINLFEKNPHFSFSPQQIFNKLGQDEISMSAIYRNLSEMVDDGTVSKVRENKGSGNFYQYIDPKHCDGIIHLKCRKCDNVIHLSKSVSQMVINLSKEELSFNIDGTTAFLYGECEKCSQILQ